MYKTNAQEIQENELNNQDDQVETVIRRSNKITETARLLKSAFSFTRVIPPPLQQPAYRGFAFSQEENGVVRQSDLIRAYDSETTSKLDENK